MDERWVEHLRAEVLGSVVGRSDAGWDAARLPWNRSVDQRPAVVVDAATADDVAVVVRRAREAGLRVCAQARGHGATVAVDGGVLLRTSSLDDVQVDTAGRLARVGAGVTWGQLQDRLVGTGLTGLVGSNPSISVVGYSLAGGLSWFSRAYGTGAESVRAAAMVDAEGRRRWIHDGSGESELLWGLRGSGGDLGLVTEVELDLHPAPELYGGRLVFSGEDARAVMRTFVRVSLEAPAQLSLWLSLLHVPDSGAVPAPLRGRRLVAVDSVFLGTPDDAEVWLGPLRARAPVVRDTLRVLGPGDVARVCEEGTAPTPYVMDGTRLQGLDEAAVEAVLSVLDEVPHGPAFVKVQVRSAGRALSRARSAAVAAGREGPFVASAMVGASPAELALVGDLPGRVVRALEPWSSGTAPLTFLDGRDDIRRAFGAEDLDRLRAVKRAVDPRRTIGSSRPLSPRDTHATGGPA